jgi:hypothetical protein
MQVHKIELKGLAPDQVDRLLPKEEMKVLLDECTPHVLKRLLTGCETIRTGEFIQIPLP